MNLLISLVGMQASYGKSHHPKEEAGRKANFIARQRMIEKHNSENKDWQMGHNKFSDMVIFQFQFNKMMKNQLISLLRIWITIQSDSERRAMLGAMPKISTSDLVFDVAVSPIEERALPTSVITNCSFIFPQRQNFITFFLS